MMVRRKPTPPQSREKRRKVVASNRPVSVSRASPKMARALERLADQAQVEPKSKDIETEPHDSEKIMIREEKKSEEIQKPEAPKPEIPKPKTPQPPSTEKPTTEERLDSPSLSNVDREYIKTLIEMGFTKEAEEELRKRSSGK
jgi:hypothetical protein